MLSANLVACDIGEKVSASSLFYWRLSLSSNLPADVVKLYIRKARESFRTRTAEAL